MHIRMADGELYKPKPDDPVRCLQHDVTVKWKALSPMQRLAVSESLCVEGSRCLLLGRNLLKKKL